MSEPRVREAKVTALRGPFSLVPRAPSAPLSPKGKGTQNTHIMAEPSVSPMGKEEIVALLSA